MGTRTHRIAKSSGGGSDGVSFYIGVTVISVLIAFLVSASTGGLQRLYKQIGLAATAMEHPETLTKEDKAELKQMIRNKDDAKKYYQGLSPEEKERAKQQFGGLSEDQKKQYRQLLGK